MQVTTTHLQKAQIQAEAERQERSGTAGSFGNVPANGADGSWSRGGPSAASSGSFVQDALPGDWIVGEVGALGVAGADVVSAHDRIQDVEDNVQLQSDKGAVVVVDALRRIGQQTAQDSAQKSAKLFGASAFRFGIDAVVRQLRRQWLHFRCLFL